MKYLVVVVLFIGLFFESSYAQVNSTIDDGKLERQYCVKTLTKIADPVLNALSKNELRAKMPIETNGTGRAAVNHLEAIGRLLAGMAPWLELGSDNTPEGILREKYIRLSLLCIKNAVDPKSPDFMNFTKGGQPVVDAAFFAQGLTA